MDCSVPCPCAQSSRGRTLRYGTPRRLRDRHGALCCSQRPLGPPGQPAGNRAVERGSEPDSWSCSPCPRPDDSSRSPAERTGCCRDLRQRLGEREPLSGRRGRHTCGRVRPVLLALRRPTGHPPRVQRRLPAVRVHLWTARWRKRSHLPGVRAPCLRRQVVRHRGTARDIVQPLW